MKLHSTVQNEAILSNVSEIGEFRIRNSAKAFNILSSGLYANKIRAIIRELSCNAIDSHVAAGRGDTPFDVHLPNALEPYFSIRDYGTGLDHTQVTNIYTTYFESTKTGSNDFIGALGLGSKSPFSYTDNFTVTAVKDGRKGIYTAFINEQGVPSIALMMEEATSDPNGVEVQFAVNNSIDYVRFRSEAQHVYEYFSLRPVINGSAGFKFVDPEYAEKNIIPGVHHLANSIRYTSFAVMGNIKYPIEVPNADQALGNLGKLLHCGLVLEFDIGELDFQASREGLSYIPQTIESIRRKLVALNDQLAIHVKKKADKIDNLWERAVYLKKIGEDSLWNAAVKQYIFDTKFPLVQSLSSSSYLTLKTFRLSTKDLEDKYNVMIRGFTRTTHSDACSTIKDSADYKVDKTNNTTSVEFYFPVEVTQYAYFIVNETKVGALERAKFHWKHSDAYKKHPSNVYVIESVDKNIAIDLDGFFKEIYNPPAKDILNVGDLLQKERKSLGKNVTIMRLAEGSRRGSWGSSAPIVWRDAGKADSFDAKNTYYYLPLSGYQNLGVCSDVKQMHADLIKSGVYTGTIYGVRKTDMEWVQAQKNWINLDRLVNDKLAKVGDAAIMGLVKRTIDINSFYCYNAVSDVKNKNSPYLKLYNVFKDYEATDKEKFDSIRRLMQIYGTKNSAQSDLNQLVQQYRVEVNNLQHRYPLLKYLAHSASRASVSEYINLIDDAKGV